MMKLQNPYAESRTKFCGIKRFNCEVKCKQYSIVISESVLEIVCLECTCCNNANLLHAEMSKSDMLIEKRCLLTRFKFPWMWALISCWFLRQGPANCWTTAGNSAYVRSALPILFS